MSAPESIDRLLGPAGALASALEGYEQRPEQLALAKAVERALDERSYLVAEAGTGTGKTLAYLLPAVLSGRRVVISTATKNLQEQVFLKDIPFVKERLGLEFDAACLKGRANYLCQKRFSSFELAPLFSTSAEAALWPRLREWAHATQTGDRAEADLPDVFSAWPALSTTSSTCLGPKCPSYEPCFVTQARRRAESSSVVVVNHALFFADLALKGTRAEGVLPPYEAVIFDEAHALPDVATEFFGSHVSSARFDELSRDAQGAYPEGDARRGMLAALGLKVSGLAERFFRAVSGRLGLAAEASVRLSAGSLAPLDVEARALDESLAALASYVAGAEELEVAALARRAGELSAELAFIREAASPEHVFWAEQRGRAVVLSAAPIEVAGSLRRLLYGAVDTAIFTSATLRVGQSFGFFLAAVGLDAPGEDASPVRTLAVDSPFDFARQAALYTPRLPDPSSPGFISAAADEIVALAEVTGGRCFALFTSLKNMEAAHALARARLPFQVLLQGERPRSALLEAFKSEPSVLFASQSFWEGVDVPGEALSLVVIDRLPFAPPGEPLNAARIERAKERGEDPFSTRQLPEAALALRQGFGRLIRTRKDRGIVAVLDPRLTSKAYGRVFLQSLPPARRFDSREGLAEWFRGG